MAVASRRRPHFLGRTAIAGTGYTLPSRTRQLRAPRLIERGRFRPGRESDDRPSPGRGWPLRRRA